METRRSSSLSVYNKNLSTLSEFANAIASSPIFMPNPVPIKIQKKFAKISKSKRPTYSKMIEEAVFKNYQNRKGVSLAIIKKYLKETYKVDVERAAKRICQTINDSVSNGRLKQRTGRGANGSFILTPTILKAIENKYEIKKEMGLRKARTLHAATSTPKKSAKKDLRLTESSVTRSQVRGDTTFTLHEASSLS